MKLIKSHKLNNHNSQMESKANNKIFKTNQNHKIKSLKLRNQLPLNNKNNNHNNQRSNNQSNNKLNQHQSQQPQELVPKSQLNQQKRKLKLHWRVNDLLDDRLNCTLKYQ